MRRNLLSIAAVVAASMSAAAQPVRLWAVHVSGPDDVHAAPDRAAAVAAAARFNDWFDQRPDKHPLDPQMHAKVIEWPHSPESHAADLPKWPAFAAHGGGVKGSNHG